MTALPETFRHITMAAGIRCSVARDPSKDGADLRRTQCYLRATDRSDRPGVCACRRAWAAIRRSCRDHRRNCLEYIEIVDGLAEAGIAVATLNPRHTSTELSYILHDCGARIAFVSADAEPVVRAADCPALERIIVIGPEYAALLQHARPAASPNATEWSAFSIPYTSGTTGKPRGVVLPHRSRVLTGFCMASEYGCYSPDDKFLAVTPLFHGAGFSFAHASVISVGRARSRRGSTQNGRCGDCIRAASPARSWCPRCSMRCSHWSPLCWSACAVTHCEH